MKILDILEIRYNDYITFIEVIIEENGATGKARKPDQNIFWPYDVTSSIVRFNVY